MHHPSQASVCAISCFIEAVRDKPRVDQYDRLRYSRDSQPVYSSVFAGHAASPITTGPVAAAPSTASLALSPHNRLDKCLIWLSRISARPNPGRFLRMPIISFLPFPYASAIPCLAVDL